MDTKRTILLMVFAFSAIMLWEGWQREHAPVVVASTTTASNAATNLATNAAVPAATPTTAAAAVPSDVAAPVAAPNVTITTDVVKATISAQGGDVIGLELLQHKSAEDTNKNFVLFDNGQQHLYVAQSGLLGAGLPNHKTIYALVSGSTELAAGQDKLEVRLQAPTVDGVTVTKVLVFKRGQYVVESHFEINNTSDKPVVGEAYFQLTRDGKPLTTDSMMLGTFTGPAIYTDAGKYQKISFEDIDKNKAKLPAGSTDGWVGMVQHYFFSAWLPKADAKRHFYAEKVDANVYRAGVKVPFANVAPASTGTVGMDLYAGPQEQNKLETMAPGLDRVVDYGWLTVIASPIFWALQWIHKVVGNWGWAIIILTVLLKLAFFPLSAASYKSMAKMRVLTPRLMRIKEQYANDRMKLNQEMMELYRKEKINPLGGCLPILIQIPVFIALYWVLLGSVEIRHAPWLGWIQDLSAMDPYYVLPLLMGVTMFIQTKLNPAPPDPIQAKVMLMMPIVFTGMFLFFPAGLVLYWTVNNLLSIAQQWQINRMIEANPAKA